MEKRMERAEKQVNEAGGKKASREYPMRIMLTTGFKLPEILKMFEEKGLNTFDAEWEVPKSCFWRVVHPLSIIMEKKRHLEKHEDGEYGEESMLPPKQPLGIKPGHYFSVKEVIPEKKLPGLVKELSLKIKEAKDEVMGGLFRLGLITHEQLSEFKYRFADIIERLRPLIVDDERDLSEMDDSLLGELKERGALPANTTRQDLEKDAKLQMKIYHLFTHGCLPAEE